MRVYADYHTHTYYSHAKGSVEENVKSAIKANLKEIGIAEHGPKTLFVGVSAKRFEKIYREIELLRDKYPEIKILFNIEANLLDYDGNIDVPPSVRSKLDMLLLGFHPNIVPSSKGFGLVFNNLLSRKLGVRKEETRMLNTKSLINAIRKNSIDLITHPGHKIDVDTKELAKACAQTNTALEINCKHGLKVKDFVDIAKTEGVKFILSTDAHHPKEVGEFSKGIKIVNQLNIPNEMILNVEGGN
ncbi:PHP domain-containing protein [Proteinivorax hydrogeniformans]|uniref:PHP domain-containing protein n=1 Tax=Proteinivorax hydrogeniformans TaxID=1826727 RepID=A0AAU8HV69_9FIRM